MDDFAPIGTGLTVFEHDEPVQGPVVWLDSPSAVLEFVSGGDVANSIVLARGGTTTFLTPALSAGVKGVMTLQGAPESHLGILSREYGIPCLMSVAFTEGVTSGRGETIPPDGAVVRLDVSGSPAGQVFIEQAARNYGATGADGPTEVDAETEATAAAQAEQLRALLASYRGEIDNGVAGNRQMRARLRSGVLDGTPANLHRDLEPPEIADMLAYSGWNLWDLIAARQTEGESGLIPRQEYETIGFVQQWSSYARWIELITDKIGVAGVIELGGLPRREIGTKANHVHIWGAGVCPLIGRAIAGQLGAGAGGGGGGGVQLDDRRNANTIIQFLRRLQYGLWGEGPGFVSGRGYRVPALAEHWLERFRDEETRLDDPDRLAAFRSFNATTELTGFLLHYDCRAGLCDTGPYPLPDGGFVIVRDHFLYEPAYAWASVLEGLPYCVTEAMFFRPDTPVEIAINDIATTFARPRNYLKYLSGVAVYARDRWDTPVEDVRRLDDAEMAAIVARCNESMLALYTSIGELTWDERIRNGVQVYCREMLLPYARAAGLWDTMLGEGFDELTPLTEQVYPTLAGGTAAQVLGAVFLMGEGLVPEQGLGEAPRVGAEALPALHAIALRGNLAELPGDPEPLLAAGLVAHTPAGYLLTEAGHRRHGELLAAERAGVDQERLSRAYERFLAVNGPMKGLSARATALDAADVDGRFELLGSVAELVGRVDPALRRSGELLPRFDEYRAQLAEALRRVEDGAWQYLTSPTVDSVHTVWMRAHEDYLRTLDRDREQEGSY